MKTLKTVILGPQHKNWPKRAQPQKPHVIETFPPAAQLEIQSDTDTGGFFLLSIAENGVTGDTWHQTITDALDQAEYQFGVEACEWTDVDKRDP